MEQLWSIPSPHALPRALLTVLDVGQCSSGPNDPFGAEAGAQAKAHTGRRCWGALRVYHRELVPPFCNAAARVLASGGFGRPE